jgi:glycosyltransferase involved in cell wall biosynthesis
MQTFSSLPDAIRNNAQLVITGEGPLYEPLLEEYGSRKDIIFTGFKMGNELNELYAAADLFLFPSATETFGNVILEAMSAGTAVIGCAAGGVKDNVRTMVNGMLCEPGSIEQFVHAVEMMYHNEELRLKLSQEARKYSLQQSWDRIFSRLFESYLGVVSGAESMKRQKAAPAK